MNDEICKRGLTEALGRAVAPAAGLLAGGRRGADALHVLVAAVDDGRAERGAHLEVLDPAVGYGPRRSAVDLCGDGAHGSQSIRRPDRYGA